MTNDTSTIEGSLQEVIDRLEDNLQAKGVNATYSASTGILGLVDQISNISQPSGGGCTRMFTGSFTTGSTRETSSTVTINYTGNGYPIAVMVFMDGGAYDPNDTDWYNAVARYDVDAFYMTKSQTSSTPTFVASSSVPANQGVVCGIYKSSDTTATTHSRNGSSSAVFFNSSDATTGYNCIRFKGNVKTLSYYIGGTASNKVGLAPSKTYAYIVIYSE